MLRMAAWQLDCSEKTFHVEKIEVFEGVMLAKRSQMRAVEGGSMLREIVEKYGEYSP